MVRWTLAGVPTARGQQVQGADPNRRLGAADVLDGLWAGGKLPPELSDAAARTVPSEVPRMPRYGSHLARRQARIARALYAAVASRVARRPVQAGPPLHLSVYTFSGRSGLPEQVACARSFLRHVGLPERFVIVSDGTYTDGDVAVLRSISPCVEVRSVAEHMGDLPGPLHPYVDEHTMGQKLSVIMSMPAGETNLYTDSDVLFFPGASALRDLVAGPGAAALYLPDFQWAGDDRLIAEPAEKQSPVNAGFLLVRKPLDWTVGVRRFEALTASGQVPEFFTDQTMTHLVMHANAAEPLDPALFVLQVDDQWDYGDRYRRPGIAMRHYVRTVRHKMWTTLL